MPGFPDSPWTAFSFLLPRKSRTSGLKCSWKQLYILSGSYTCAFDGRLRRFVTFHTSQMLHFIKKGRHSALPCCQWGGFYSFVSFYTRLQALLCRAYPPKAQWDVTMCLCLLFHLQGSLCAWNSGAHPHAFQPEVNVQRQAGAWTDPAEDCLHLLKHMYSSASAAESKGNADTLKLLIWKTSTVLSAQESRAVNYVWLTATDGSSSMIIYCKCGNVLFGKNLRLTSSKTVYIFNGIWMHINLEKRVTDSS